MKTRLTPYLIALVYDACLKSFWRKRALTAFLRQSGIADSAIGGWGPDESKRAFLDRLFAELPRSDTGRSVIVRMASFLMDQESFPDLERWEDTTEKLRAATEAVANLKAYYSKQQVELQSEDERLKARQQFAKRQQEVTRSQQNLQKLSDRLNELAQELGSQEAGYRFQEWFYDLLDFFEIDNRKPYVHQGRQIDGSLTVSGTTYLVELKFTTEQAGSRDIDSLYKKVASKADNTMGVMVSMSGYSSIARQEASGARTPLLLLDHSHMYLVLGGTMAIADLVDRVRRHASQTGEAYLEASDFGG
jgi:hypothetical protein